MILKAMENTPFISYFHLIHSQIWSRETLSSYITCFVLLKICKQILRKAVVICILLLYSLTPNLSENAAKTPDCSSGGTDISLGKWSLTTWQNILYYHRKVAKNTVRTIGMNSSEMKIKASLSFLNYFWASGVIIEWK